MKYYSITVFIALTIILVFILNTTELHADFNSAKKQKEYLKFKPADVQKVIDKKKFTSAIAEKELIASGKIAEIFKTERAFEGCMGKDLYRIEYYINEIEIDKINPLLIHVTGLTRFKKNITPFTGTYLITTVQYSDNANPNKIRGYYTYTVEGTWSFNEALHARGAGIYSGTFVSDIGVSVIHNGFYFNKAGKPSKGAGLWLKGNFLLYNSKSLKPVQFAEDFVQLDDQIFNIFEYGERDYTLNLKYASKGWSDEGNYDTWWVSNLNND